jgi:hypothetical protein
VQCERDFADFSDALGAALASGRNLSRFHAIGRYDAPNNSLEAAIASAVIR